MRLLTILLLIALALSACGESTDTSRRTMTEQADMKAVKLKLAFTCAHEKDRIPPRDPEADQLYKHARWLVKSNILKKDPAAYPPIERLIRIATAYGHDKANLELREMIAKGQAKTEDRRKEMFDLVDDLVKRGIPGGYYDMAFYIERGALGIKKDPELALKYFRKAADLGSPEAQYYVAELLAPIDNAPDVARQMRRCAAEQGHGKAGVDLGVNLKGRGQFAEALEAFQLAAKAGNDSAAGRLSKGFGPKGEQDREMYYLGHPQDPERARRYEIIDDILFRYDYLKPSVPEIDEIVPLPPARLPPWDGKLQWLENHKANVPPPLPSEERIAEMARAKGLDPQTGRPLPPATPQAASPAVPLGSQYATGQTCPASGQWTCTLTGQTRTFRTGQTFPEALQTTGRTLWQKLKGSPQTIRVSTVWELTALAPEDKA